MYYMIMPLIVVIVMIVWILVVAITGTKQDIDERRNNEEL